MADHVQIGIPELFIGKSIFITGGTGFIGKVLVEKLLRSCSGVEKIYLLTRERRGKPIQERIDEMAKLPLFDKLHKERPGDFAAKVIPLNGDVMSLRLGLCPDDRKLLIDNVHIVYHVAATVKFDQALTDAILMNIRGTREVAELSLQMKHIQMMVHVSTAYAHTQYDPIEEQMYPATADWRQCIAAAEKLDAYELSTFQGLILGPYPNTYTYTKGLAEHVVYDLLNDKVPNMIIRPSIIVSTWRDPIPGWIDNFNGPVGMLAANGTGLVRINLVKEQALDFVPVDIAARAFLNVTWYRLTQDSETPEKATSVHNCSANKFSNLSTYELATMAHELAAESPLSTCVWYPSLRRTESQTIFNIIFLLLHIPLALFFDLILRLLNIKPVVLTIQRRIFVAVNALKYFILNAWTINHISLYNIETKLYEKDVKNFGYDATNLNQREFFRNGMLGAKRYLLKEDMTKVEASKLRFRILKQMDRLLTVVIYIYMFYLIFLKWNIPGVVYEGLGNYFASLKTPYFYAGHL